MSKRSNGERIQFRASQDEIKTLNNIRAAGEFPDKSSTVRFCIDFTKTVLSVLPEAIGEAYIEALKEQKDDF